VSDDWRALVAAAERRLAAAGVESPRHDAVALLAWALGVDRSALATTPIGADAEAVYDSAVTRRSDRVPLQHITRSAGFRYLDLEVGPGVFVPRPETEVMAGAAVDELRRLVAAGNPSPVAVDLCSGSGAVAVALASEVPGCQVTAVEVSAAAHAYAVRNAAGHDVDVRLGDIADAVDDLAGRVDVVVANPPYIPLDAYESVAREAREFDPALALWSGPDGLDAIREVATVSARLLVDGGLVLCEHADVQGDSAPAVFAAGGVWSEVRDHPDLAGRPRFVTARRVARRTAATGAGTIGG